MSTKTNTPTIQEQRDVTERLAGLLASGEPIRFQELDTETQELVALLAQVKGDAGVDRSALETSQTACVHVDLDRVITYVNPATMKLVGGIRSDLERAFPRANFDNLVGTCIDVFHQNPEMQRRLLADERNLPHVAEIEIGHLKIQLNVTALRDANGKHAGTRLEWYDVTETRKQEAENKAYASQVRAINRSLATIEFEMDGTIIKANDNFLSAVGYTLDEIQGRHHRMFVDSDEANSHEYRNFWAALNRGEFFSDVYKRFGKGGREIWIQATYNPSLDENGKPFKVVKCATDVTEDRLRNADYEGQIEAIGKSQAVIEFDTKGNILNANDAFLATTGYMLQEIQGRHHGMFVDEGYRQSAEYKEFWEKLARGEYQASEYRRFGKGGREIWIQASYNPILDLNGKPFKVVKYATDVTARKLAAMETERFVAEMSSTLKSLAQQDLTARMAGEFSGEHAETQSYLNQAIETLEEALTRVSGVAGRVSSASSNIAESSTQLAQGASTQASAIEEVSASLEEMSSMTSQNADNAVEAQVLADAAKDSANKGEIQMNRMSEAIDAIKASSDETAKIVKTIDEISFQTNMLALNAAVEAARAGDAGKGFAVVAEEVRSLAQRSAQAAKSTAELIDGSAKNVGKGVAITQEVQAILTEITTGAAKVSSLITEIAAASKEQSEGIDQVTAAVTDMNRVTQENAASSEESSAAAGQLDEHVAQLVELIERFRLTQSDERFEQAPAKAQARPARSSRTKPAPAAPQLPPQQAFPLDDDEFADF